jgi:membrane protein implicated in regulation of membrane protease activity
VNREVAVILALGALAVAAVVVSIGSWMLLWAERRAARRTNDPGERAEAKPSA